ncbi:hypothetical protein Pan14r_47560 [Crateriforma conspicua]|uniref:Uncharacterized protein n=1 Tax=Crateriforma conspicua TaxID=2527996 RepID=A0A5C5Y9R5_9PLAN|nr:hypothetical protein Pan14r_47560 [Crateriforma conspicua]
MRLQSPAAVKHTVPCASRPTQQCIGIAQAIFSVRSALFADVMPLNQNLA